MAKKYSKKAINETRSLVKAYFEAYMVNPDDGLHEILLEFCEKNGLVPVQLPFLKDLAIANKRIRCLEEGEKTNEKAMENLSNEPMAR